MKLCCKPLESKRRLRELRQLTDGSPDQPRDDHGRWTEGTTVYHSSPHNFDSFDVAKAGMTTDPGALGRGLYFSDDPNGVGRSGIKYKVSLKLTNPLEVLMPDFKTRKVDVVSTALGLKAPETRDEMEVWSRLVTETAQKLGHDGIILNNAPTGYKGKEFVVFNNNSVSIVEKQSAVTKPLLDAMPITSRDPSGTAALRAKYWRETKARWKTVARTIHNSVAVNNMFTVHSTVSALATSTDKTRAFQAWFDELLRAVVLAGGQWVRPYVEEAAADANARARGFLKGDAGSSTDRLSVLHALAYTELQGIAEATSQQVMRVVAQGLLSNARPQTLSRAITDRIAKVGMARSRMWVEYMVIKTFSATTLQAFRDAGIKQVGTRAESSPPPMTQLDQLFDAARKVRQKRDKRTGRFKKFIPVPSPTKVSKLIRFESKLRKTLTEWGQVEVQTAEDDLVCSTCKRIEENGPYSIDRAESLIPAHPNCRCVFIPAGEYVSDFDPNQPRGPDGQWIKGYGPEASGAPTPEDVLKGNYTPWPVESGHYKGSGEWIRWKTRELQALQWKDEAINEQINIELHKLVPENKFAKEGGFWVGSDAWKQWKFNGLREKGKSAEEASETVDILANENEKYLRNTIEQKIQEYKDTVVKYEEQRRRRLAKENRWDSLSGMERMQGIWRQDPNMTEEEIKLKTINLFTDRKPDQRKLPKLTPEEEAKQFPKSYEELSLHNPHGYSKQQELEMLSRKIAVEMSYDPRKVFFSGEGYKFEVNGQKMTAAGCAYTRGGGKQGTEQYYEGDIVMFREGTRDEGNVNHVMPHEVEHQIFQTVLNAAKTERIVAFANGHLKKDESISAEHAEAYPVYDQVGKYFYQDEDEVRDRLAMDDGVTNYSRIYWQDYEKDKTDERYRSAVHETLAEMARLKWQYGKEAFQKSRSIYEGHFYEKTYQDRQLRLTVVKPVTKMWEEVFDKVDTAYIHARAAAEAAKIPKPVEPKVKVKISKAHTIDDLTFAANPSKFGTKAFKYFEMLRTSKTVGEYYEKGGDRAYLEWFMDRGKVKIKAPEGEQPEAPKKPKLPETPDKPKEPKVKGDYGKHRQIDVSGKKNPSKFGTKAWEHYERLALSKTIGEYYEKGGSLAYLKWFVERGKVRIHD